MASNGYQVPDLESILQTLRSYAPSDTTTTTASATPTEAASYALHPLDLSAILRGDSFQRAPPVAELSNQCEPEDHISKTPVNDPRLARRALNHDPAPPQQSQLPQSSKIQDTKPSGDPTTIIDWVAAVRYTTKLLGGNEQFANQIRKMVVGQHDHERQWWAGREALLEKQRGRVDGKRKLEEVLRAVGGQMSSQAGTMDDTAELARYDMKVYNAATQMTEAMTGDLVAMGIPFFATKPSLVTDTLDDNPQDTAVTPDQPGVTRAQLRKLQHKMLHHLEEVYGE